MNTKSKLMLAELVAIVNIMDKFQDNTKLSVDKSNKFNEHMESAMDSLCDAYDLLRGGIDNEA